MEQFNSIFADLFGARGPTRDVQMSVVLTLAEAERGVERAVEATRRIPCEACEGRGGPREDEPRVCRKCAGAGTRAEARGAFTINTTCAGCRGAGRTWEDPCAACDGLGARTTPGTWTVKIPPGVGHGHKLRLKGQGNDLGDGPGDAYVVVHVDMHSTLQRRGDDLVTRVRIKDALRESGGELRVAWIDRDVPVAIPAGCAHRTEIRVRGWGMPKLGQPYTAPPAPGGAYRSSASDTRGDLVVVALTQDDPEEDPYEVLGVAPGASLAEIQTAYRTLAAEHHPDRHPDDPAAAERFERMSAAYAKLAQLAQIPSRVPRLDAAWRAPRPPDPGNGTFELRAVAIGVALFAVVVALLLLNR